MAGFIERRNKNMTTVETKAPTLTGVEKCVRCEKETKIPKNLHIYDPGRLGCYVETSGQLCPKCFHEVYFESPRV